MSHTTSSTRPNRVAETFDRPRRSPFVIAAIVSLIVAALVACNVKSDKHTDSGVVTRPDTAVPQPASDSATPASTIPQNVSFETADSAYQQHRYQDASAMFTVYVQRRPNNPWGHYMLGLSAWKAGQLDVARTAFERSLALDSGQVKTYLNLGRVLLEQDKPREALERVTAATQIDATSAEAFRMMGRVQSALGQPDSAIGSYRVALSLDENDVWSMNNMALLLIQQERYDDALPALARAVEIRAGSPVFQNNLGVALERTGHFLAAQEAYAAAVAADSTYVKAQTSLSRVTGLEDDPSTTPVDLAALAQKFELDVATWKAEGPMKVGVVKPDSVTVPKP